MSDIASTSWSEYATSNTASPPDGWPENMNFSDVNNTARETHAAIKRFWDRINPTVTLGGSSTAYTYTPTSTVNPVSYSTGELYCAIANTSNSSTSPTVNVQSLGARTYKKYVSGVKSALAVGDIPAGQPHCFYADSTTTDVVLLTPAAATLNGTETLTNKTFVAPTLGAAAATSINFGGSTPLSAYDEGSWTPVLAGASTPGTNTYSSQVGRYIRIGNIVTVWCDLVLATKDAAMAGSLRITGLPFTASNISGYNAINGINYFDNVTFTANYTNLASVIASNTNIVQIFQSASGASGGASTVAPSNISGTTSFHFQISYRIN